MATPQGGDPTELERIVRAEVDEARTFIEDEIGRQRAESIRYYRGERPRRPDEDGLSGFVSRDVRDAVRQLLPPIMETFFASGRAVEFQPQGPEDVEAAAQATDYINYVILREQPGFRIFHDAFKNALYGKAGIIKYWWDERTKVSYHSMSGMTVEAIGALTLDEGEVEVVEAAENPDGTLDVIIKRTQDMKGSVRIAALPPEEFLIDRRARTIDDARFVGHMSMVPVYDLLEMGYDMEDIRPYIEQGDSLNRSEERYTRRPDGYWPNTSPSELTQDVEYVEAYLRYDMDEDGLAELLKVCTMGNAHNVVHWEPVDERPFASFRVDPEPHVFFGDDVSDWVKPVQDVKTEIQRRTLDGLAKTLYPDREIVEGRVNEVDAASQRAGNMIRVDMPGMVRDIVTPDVTPSGLRYLEYMDDVKATHTGQHNLALEADNLQSTTKAAVTAQERAATQNQGLIIRLLAEDGMTRLFQGLLRLMTKHQDRKTIVRLRGRFVEINPQSWNANMDCVVNVGLGSGQREEKMMILDRVMNYQAQAMSQLGPNNPWIGLGHLSATMDEWLRMAEYKDTTRFHNPLPPDFQLPQPPPKPTPEEVIAQVESQKTQADMVMDAAKLELNRDKALADIILRAREQDIGLMEIQQAMETNRLTNGQS